MKKIILIISLSLVLLGCSSTNNNQESKPNTNQDIVESDVLELTMDELAQFDGKNGNKAYVAVDGDIYDVTGNRKWLNGEHENGITAGKDLTDLILDSPHGKDILKDFKVIGKLVD